MPIDPETGEYWTPKYRSKFEAIRTVASCIGAIGTILVLLCVFGIL